MVLMEFFAKNCRFEVPNPVKQGGYISHYSIRFTVVMFTIGSWWFNPSNRLTRLCIKQRTTSACPLQHATNNGVRPAIFWGPLLKVTTRKIIIKPRITILRRCGVFNALYQSNLMRMIHIQCKNWCKEWIL